MTVRPKLGSDQKFGVMPDAGQARDYRVTVVVQYIHRWRPEFLGAG